MMLDSRAAAHRLGVAPQTLANWRHTGKGPAFAKLGSKVVYNSATLDAWVAERTMARTPAPRLRSVAS